jgi:hypothetical protein
MQIKVRPLKQAHNLNGPSLHHQSEFINQPPETGYPKDRGKKKCLFLQISIFLTCRSIFV